MRDLLSGVCHRSRAILLVAALFASAAGVAAEPLVVVVNPASGVESMTRNEVASVFMARQRTLASGVTALPLDIAGNAPERQQFYESLVGKTLPEVNAYWARLLFTGRASPPQQVADCAEVIATVAANKSAIAYIPKSRVDSRVRVVLELAQ